MVLINCNQVSCGFHSKKSKAKINDLQQVAMAVNKHLTNALSSLHFFQHLEALGCQAKLQVNSIVEHRKKLGSFSHVYLLSGSNLHMLQGFKMFSLNINLNLISAPFILYD